MRQAGLVDWIADGQLIFDLRRAHGLRASELNPILDPQYQPFVNHISSEEERRLQVDRLRRLARTHP